MKYIFISLIMLCLTSCAITGESVYEGADGKTYRQVNAGIAMPFTNSSTHVTVAEVLDKEQYSDLIKNEIDTQPGWASDLPTALSSMLLLNKGLRDSATSVNNTTNNINKLNSETNNGKPHKGRGH